MAGKVRHPLARSHNERDGEYARLDALKAFRILDTEEDKLFDNITTLAAELCETPIALISLVDEERQWFKSRKGLTVCETAREYAFCRYTILSDEVLVIRDATLDVRTRNNPLVLGEPNIRFYAGAPLITHDGFSLGSLCVIDQKPRDISSFQLSSLKRLAEHVIFLMERRKTLRQLMDVVAQSSKNPRIVTVCGFCKSVKQSNGNWMKLEEPHGEDLTLSHGICPSCYLEYFSELLTDEERKKASQFVDWLDNKMVI
ncbi:MAG: GAF domain-containing protein [Candidatus Sumerlaeia bacterium]|nr:GAF domain-containing protein [Candidatus Sumerlaeia bacterium]